MSDYEDSERFTAGVYASGSPNERVANWPFDWRPMVGDAVMIDIYQHTVRKVVFDPEQNDVYVFVSRTTDADEVGLFGPVAIATKLATQGVMDLDDGLPPGFDRGSL